MIRATTATSNLRGGSAKTYQAMRRNHHDRTNDNETNKDIKSELSYLNEQHTYVDDVDDFIKQETDGRIEKYDERQVKNPSRKRGSYEAYLAKEKEKSVNKGYKPERTTPHWQYLRHYSNKEDFELMLKAFERRGVEKEEVIKAVMQGIKNHVEDFNEKYEGSLKILEGSYHGDEATVHMHANLFAYGELTEGKRKAQGKYKETHNPVVSINQALENHYFKTGQMTLENQKEWTNSKKWQVFHEENDMALHASVTKCLEDMLKSKSVFSKVFKQRGLELPAFERKEAEVTGLAMDAYKAMRKQATEELDDEKASAYEAIDFADEMQVEALEAQKRALEATEALQRAKDEREAVKEQNQAILDENERVLKELQEKTERNEQAERRQRQLLDELRRVTSSERSVAYATAVVSQMKYEGKEAEIERLRQAYRDRYEEQRLADESFQMQMEEATLHDDEVSKTTKKASRSQRAPRKPVRGTKEKSGFDLDL